MRTVKQKYAISIVYPQDISMDRVKVYYTGKVIGDTYYRNLKLNNVILWNQREFGLNVEIFNFLKEKGIKYIFYIDTACHDLAYKMTLEKFDAMKVLKEFKFGKQYFVPVDAAVKKTRYPKLPYIKKEVMIFSKNILSEEIVTGINTLSI